MDGWMDGWIPVWVPYLGHLTRTFQTSNCNNLMSDSDGQPRVRGTTLYRRRTWSHTIRTHSTPMCKLG